MISVEKLSLIQSCIILFGYFTSNSRQYFISSLEGHDGTAYQVFPNASSVGFSCFIPTLGRDDAIRYDMI